MSARCEESVVIREILEGFQENEPHVARFRIIHAFPFTCFIMRFFSEGYV